MFLVVGLRVPESPFGFRAEFGYPVSEPVIVGSKAPEALRAGSLETP
jgi:hypothetical protein